MFAVEGYDKNYNVYKDRVTIPMFIITGPEFQWLEGWKSEFQCL